MSRRTYHQFCPLARALDILGDRWTLLVVRELLLGPKRFTDLGEALGGIGTNLLAERLKALEAAGLIRRATLPPPAASRVYELTERGRDLEPAVVALARWGVGELGRRRRGEAFRPSWLALSLKATFRADLARGVRETYEYRVGDETFHARIDDGTLEIVQGPAAAPDLVFETDPDTFVAIGSGALDPVEAATTGRLRAQGPPETLLRSVELLAPAAG